MSREKLEKFTRYILLTVTLACLFYQFMSIFRYDINWDEFYYLSLIYQFQDGALTRSFQTFHVHLFGWLAGLGADEMSQVRVARVVAFACHCGTLFFIFAIGRRFTDTLPALAAVAGYCAFSFVTDHAASFRTDPFATVLLMAALYISLVGQWSRIWFAGAGALIALAGLITIKSIFLAVMIGAVMLFEGVRSGTRGKAMVAIFLAAVSSLSTFAILYVWHSSLLVSEAETAGRGMLSHSFQKTIVDTAFFPQWQLFVRAALENITILAAIIFGFALVLGRLITARGETRWAAVVCASFLIPLLTLLFYRNAFPYYYPFVLAPAAILIAVAMQFVLSASFDAQRYGRVVLIFLFFFAVQFAQNVWRNQHRTAETQAATISAVHSMFEEPVNYIDRNSMIGSFPKQGLFMSSWGLENYHARGEPVMPDILADKQPKFVLANTSALDLEDKRTAHDLAGNGRLMPQDLEVLRANYIHHWGNIYVAGKRFPTLESDVPREFEILVEGTYTMEGTAPLSIDGRAVTPGDQIFLNQGPHIVEASGRVSGALLRWGAHLYKPDFPAPTAPIFFGF